MACGGFHDARTFGCCAATQAKNPGFLQAVDTGSCFIDRAVRDGNAVKVVFAKGVEPHGVVMRTDGSRTFFNGESMEKVKSRYRVVLGSPRSYVILHKGDKLAIIGMDDGCTATLVMVGGMLGLKLQYGMPRIPGAKQHLFTHFLPVAGGM